MKWRMRKAKVGRWEVEKVKKMTKDQKQNLSCDFSIEFNMARILSYS